MTVKIIMLVLFFAVMLGVGINCRKHATDVNGFVLGGRSVGPWLTAFALEHRTFRRLYLSDTQVSSAGSSALRQRGSISILSALCLLGVYSEEEQGL